MWDVLERDIKRLIVFPDHTFAIDGGSSASSG